MDTYLEKRRCLRLYYSDPRTSAVFDLIRQVRSETTSLLTLNEGMQLYYAVQAVNKLDGDIAEVGAYMGSSAKLMHLADPSKLVYACDTFEGLPVQDCIRTDILAGEYVAPYEQVRTYVSAYPSIHLIKGFFPDSAEALREKTFSFVHLDTDLYQSTFDALVFFYPRLRSGGGIILHDYQSHEGVEQAFRDFFQDKPEPVIPISGTTQCLVQKI